MGTTIVSGASVITPTIVTEYTSEREAGNIVHPILGRPSPDVTLRVANLRTGSLTLGFAGATSETDSANALWVLSQAATCGLSSDERSSIPMAFVVQGAVSRTLDDESRSAWLVSFDYQEINL